MRAHHTVNKKKAAGHTVRVTFDSDMMLFLDLARVMLKNSTKFYDTVNIYTR